MEGKRRLCPRCLGRVVLEVNEKQTDSSLGMQKSVHDRIAKTELETSRETIRPIFLREV